MAGSPDGWTATDAAVTGTRVGDALGTSMSSETRMEMVTSMPRLASPQTSPAACAASYRWCRGPLPT